MKKIHSPIKSLTWLLLIFVNGAFAQILKQKDSYTVYINYPDYTIKTSVSNSTRKYSVDESRTYYWYTSNKIIQTKGDYDGKLVDGPYTSFYLSNNLKEKGNFKKGLKHGKWISWYENGKIENITNWKNGKKSGLYKKFNADESLSLTSNYKNDKLNGVQTTYTNGVFSQTKFRNGKEIVRKQKQHMGKDSVAQTKSRLFKKNKNNNTTQPTATKKTGKQKWNSFLKKDEKKSDPPNVIPESPKDVNASDSGKESQKKPKRKKSGT